MNDHEWKGFLLKYNISNFSVAWEIKLTYMLQEYNHRISYTLSLTIV